MPKKNRSKAPTISEEEYEKYILALKSGESYSLTQNSEQKGDTPTKTT